MGNLRRRWRSRCVAAATAALILTGGAPGVPESMSVEEWVEGLLARDLQLVTRWGLVQPPGDLGAEAHFGA